MNLEEAIRTAKKAKRFDYETWLQNQELKDLFPPRVMLLWWLGILGMVNYNLAERFVGWDLGLLWVSTFVVAVALLIGFFLGIEQKKNR